MGLGNVPYAIQLQAEGAPGNLSPRSAEQLVTPTSAPPNRGDPTLCEWHNDTVTIDLRPYSDYMWSRVAYFAPDVTAIRVTLHAQFLILNSSGAYTGQTRIEPYVSVFDAASACNDTLSSCRVTIGIPDGTYHQSTVTLQVVDAAGNLSTAVGGSTIGDAGNRRCP